MRRLPEILTFLQAASALSLVREQEDSEVQINTAISPLESFDVPDASLIIRSSDNVDFRVHKSILAMASPFFEDLLSLPQPPDGENVNGLSVVQLPESSELLACLISILYPVHTAKPKSYHMVLY
jgi:BTB/POZ domain